MGERVPLERLLTALQDSAWQVREMAVLALGARGGHIPRSALTLALQDEDESVRRAAHFLQETYPDRFAETAAGLPASVSEESGEPAVDPQVQASLQRYPRKGALRVLRVALLVCWSIFLGYLVSIIWNLVQLTHADQAQLTARFVDPGPIGPVDSISRVQYPCLGAWSMHAARLAALHRLPLGNKGHMVRTISGAQPEEYMARNLRLYRKTMISSHVRRSTRLSRSPPHACSHGVLSW